MEPYLFGISMCCNCAILLVLGSPSAFCGNVQWVERKHENTLLCSHNWTHQSFDEPWDGRFPEQQKGRRMRRRLGKYEEQNNAEVDTLPIDQRLRDAGLKRKDRQLDQESRPWLCGSSWGSWRYLFTQSLFTSHCFSHQNPVLMSC